MPLTSKGRKIMAAMLAKYGPDKGERVFYASRNKGTIKGVEKVADADKSRRRFRRLMERRLDPADFEKWLDNNPRYREKSADSWLERWLALHATRDAANMQNPTADALSAKLGGPFSFGLGEAVGNMLTLGNTRQKRQRNLERAVQKIEDKSYGEAAADGFKASLPYAGFGALGGAAHSALSGGLTLRELLQGAGVGAGLGVGAAVTRPLAQKAILDLVSRRAKRKAIAIKADSPLSTSLPFGDIVAAAAHPEATKRSHICPSAFLP